MNKPSSFYQLGSNGGRGCRSGFVESCAHLGSAMRHFLIRFRANSESSYERLPNRYPNSTIEAYPSMERIS